MLTNLLMTDTEVGIVTFFLGMAIVFLGIAILVLSVVIIGKIVNAKKEEVKPVVSATIPTTPSLVVKTEEGVPEHIKVAITAAIYAYYAERKSGCEFVVRKISRRR